MNHKINLTPYILLLLGGILISSCITTKKSDPVEELRKSISDLNPRLMLSSDAARLIEESEADYLPEITLSTSIIEKYMAGDTLLFLSNELQAAALMGIYSADVVYHLAFLNRDQAFESYTAAQLIANELGFGDIYVTNLLSRHESEDFSIDSMIYEVDQALIKVDKSYSATDRARILLVFLAANYIEKQYYIHATVQAYKNKNAEPDKKIRLAKEFVLMTLSQEKAINTLIDLIEKNKYAEDSGYLLGELKVLRDNFARIAPLKERIDDLSPADIFENPDFDAMFAQLQLIRNYFTTNMEK